MVKKTPQQKKTFSQIKHEWERIQCLDPKSRFKSMRLIGNMIYDSYEKEEVSLDELEFYMAILKQVARTQSFSPRYSRLLSKLIGDWVELTGNDKAEIISKVSGKIPGQMTCIAIADPSYFIVEEEVGDEYIERKFVQLMNLGKALIFEGDGKDEINIQIRVVDSPMPVLTIKEYKCVVDASEQAIIHIPSGLVVVADLIDLNHDKYHVSTQVIPGNYKICVYYFHIRNKLDSLYVVLCKTEEEANNSLVKIHDFSSVRYTL
jgi:hypothetical protein